MTKTVNIDEAKTTLPKLLSLVTSGNEVIIAKDNKPIAKIIPISPPIRVRVAGLNKGKIWVSEDFDEPLPEQFWTGRVRKFNPISNLSKLYGL